MSYRSPLCPVNNAHGQLLDWSGDRWFCSHEGHGSNGRLFSFQEGIGQVPVKENEMSATAQFAQAVQRVLAGEDAEVVATEFAKASKQGRASVLARLTTATATEKPQPKPEPTKTAKTSKATKSSKATKPAKPAAKKDATYHPSSSAIQRRPKNDAVEPAEFAAKRDALGLTNHQVAEAIGKSLSRVSELTRSQGASTKTFEAFCEALDVYAKAHK